MRKKENIDIWKDILEKNFSSKSFPDAKSIRHDKEDYRVQLFELLVAETLNLHDRNITWEVTKSGQDKGVDIIGHEKQNANTPFIRPFELISLGQVKRRASSYRYDDFKNDLFKVNEYCKDSEFFKKYSLKQFLFILSSDKCSSISNIQKRFQEDHNRSLKMLTLSYVDFIDAHEIFLSWKNNYKYFERLVKNALTDNELKCFKQFVDDVEGNWISVSVSSLKEGIANMPVEQILTFQTDNKELGLDILIKWYPKESEDIQLLHPLPMYDPRGNGYRLHISGKKELKLLFRSPKIGKNDFGKIEVCSIQNQFLVEANLNSINLKDGLSICYYDKPNKKIYTEMERALLDEKSQEFLPILIEGNGGIGKSTLISEILSHAVQRGYVAFDIAQPKDQQHGRFVLKRLFREMVCAEDEQQIFDHDMPSYLYKFLGNNLVKDWVISLNNYFEQEFSEINTSFIAECMSSCIIKMSLENPVFIWLSDLQWASPETISVLEIVLDELQYNQKFFGNKVLIIFEGRNNENLMVENHSYYPAHWDAFTQNYLLKPYELRTWSNEQSQEFLTYLFHFTSSEKLAYQKYLTALLDKARGNPMHMVEMIRYLLEENRLKFNGQQQLMILNPDLSDFQVKDILGLITKRIEFYRLKISNFIDILIIIAKLNGISPVLYQRLIQKFCTDYKDLEQLKQQCAFGTEMNNQFIFAHENYLTVFRNCVITNEKITEEALDFYLSMDKNDDVVLSCIVLKRNLSNCNLYELRREIINILSEIVSIHSRMSLYHMLLELPPLPDSENDLTKSCILFQLCELHVQDGNWENGATYLRELFDIPDCQSYENILYKLKAKQEISNILADMLQFDEAIYEANDGIELADIYIDCENFSPNEIHNFMREREKLRARLAVCHWFSGNLTIASDLQKQAYALSEEVNDIYAKAHVLYEIGTLQLHWDYNKGINTIRDAQTMGKNCPDLQCEQTLMEVQLLIGLLIKATVENDEKELDSIKRKTKYLLDGYRSIPHVYEEFLCYTIEGICFVKKSDFSHAITSFLNSLKRATESHMKNLEWKALFNIAQLYLMNKIYTSARIYAARAQEILNQALTDNPESSNILKTILAPVFERLDCCLKGDDILKNASMNTICPMLSILHSGYLFVIMN